MQQSPNGRGSDVLDSWSFVNSRPPAKKLHILKESKKYHRRDPVNLLKKNLLLLSLTPLSVLAAGQTITYILPDPPVVFMVDVTPPKGQDKAMKGAPKACMVVWDEPYLAVDAVSVQEMDIEWGKELRDYKGHVLAESHFSSPEQVEQLMSLYKAAMQGDAAAMAHIGNRYYDGLGLPNNFSWFRRAQDKPNALLGMRQMAQRYYDHEGGAYIRDKAFFWSQRAADNGDIESQLWMGDYYADTDHLNGMMALKWYGKAAAAKEIRAYYGIGELYEQGRGIPQDYVQAAKWYEKAGREGLNAAQYHLGQFYAQGKGVSYDPIRAWAWLEISKLRGDNLKVNQLQTALIADMLPEQRLYAADLAVEYRLFNTGPRQVMKASAEKIVKKAKPVKSKKSYAKANYYDAMD